jgi:hypothetical protein
MTEAAVRQEQIADPKAETERPVYEPPVLREVGNFADRTQGKSGPKPEGSVTQGKY